MADNQLKSLQMLKISSKIKKRIFLFCLSLLATPICNAAEQLDSTKYITIDEIKPGMQAYCLTAYKGTQVEKFSMEVLDVVRNVMPGRDAILVVGTDERFIRTGPVGGCSGSPVYIDDRLAGALAFGWSFSKDPLYGVTPIEYMLKVTEQNPSQQQTEQMGFTFDFSAPIDFAEIDRQMSDSQPTIQHQTSGIEPLPCPLIISGLPAGVVEQLNNSVQPFGFTAVAGIAASTNTSEANNVKLEPGACLVVPLITGDIAMEVVGTVTEVKDDKVYGFGHSFLGHGPVDFPMATGKVHTVVSNLLRSFKFASAIKIVGALTTDESAAVLGRIGAEAKMIPLTIKVDRYNDPEKRVYNCQVVNNRLLTPLIVRSALAGATLMLGSLPPDNMIEYKANIDIFEAEPITFQNVSTVIGLDEMLSEGAGSVAILLNNPYKKVDIKSIDFNIRLTSKNIASRIWSVDLSDTKVKAGQELKITAIVESPLSQKKKYHFTLNVPDELTPGQYDLIVCGGYDYREFLKEAAPYKFIPNSLNTLLEAMNNLLHIERDKLHCLLVLPPAGVAVEKAELPDLPATKALILLDAKRTLKTQPYLHWLEKNLKTGNIIIDKKVMKITVEQQ